MAHPHHAKESTHMTSHVAGWDPVKLHQRNARLLGARDVVVAGDPGAGNALVGNIALELGLDYLDPYTEVVVQDGSSLPTDNRMSYRQRMAATAARDDAVTEGAAHRRASRRRFVKTHLYPDLFEGVGLCGAMLLVRDPRDTIYSGYKWFRGFSESWWQNVSDTKGKSTFIDYLDGHRIGDGRTPISGWTAFYDAWLNAAHTLDRFTVVRFEDLKTNPVGTVTAMLASFGLTPPVHEIRRAIELSSFDAMRSHEDKVSQADGDARTKDARIMRRGKVGEWQEWIGEPGVAEQFEDPELVATAARFGYDLSSGDRAIGNVDPASRSVGNSSP
jgi:hypothetical protein